MDVVELCKKYRHEGVVAIDLAGDESLNCEANSEHRQAYEVSFLRHGPNTDSLCQCMREIKKVCALVCLYSIYFNHSLACNPLSNY